MADFEKAVNKLLVLEGGFSSVDVKPEVGAVNWGITQRFLRSVGLPSGVEHVRSLTRDDAKEIYRTYFWAPLKLDGVRSQGLAELVFVSAVNTGPAPAVKLLQKSLNSLGSNLKVDGVLGRLTLFAMNSTPEDVIINEYKTRLKDRYTKIASRRPNLYGRYLHGWLRRVDESG